LRAGQADGDLGLPRKIHKLLFQSYLGGQSGIGTGGSGEPLRNGNLEIAIKNHERRPGHNRFVARDGDKRSATSGITLLNREQRFRQLRYPSAIPESLVTIYQQTTSAASTVMKKRTNTSNFGQAMPPIGFSLHELC
jgi:hypothetical protein